MPLDHCPRANGRQDLALADHVSAHGPGIDGVAIPRLLGELDAPRHGHSDQWRSHGSIGENGVDLTGHRFEHVLQELPGRLPVRLVGDLQNGKRACGVDADEQRQFALSSLQFGNIDMQEADGGSV